ncbi:MAG TPA: hypothetical protein V6C46_06835, partial [Coleofasciculaceae cyanobacterium]
RLVEIIELPGHPFFLATQFHPEFQSRPNHPHPLFKGLVQAALQRQHSHQPGPTPPITPGTSETYNFGFQEVDSLSV